MAFFSRLAHPLVGVAAAAALGLWLATGAAVEAALGAATARAAIWDSPVLDLVLALGGLHFALALGFAAVRRNGSWSLAALQLGLLLLALGSLWTRSLGSIGSTTLAVGASTDAFDLPGFELRARWGQGREAVADLGVAPCIGPVQWNGGDGPELHLVDAATDARLQVGLVPGSATDGPGVQLRFRTLSTSFSTWLVGGTPFFKSKQVGPFEVEHLVAPDDATLQEWLPARPVDSGRVTIVLAGNGERVELELPSEVGRTRAVGNATVVAHRFLLHARLLGEQLVDDPSAPVNPAAIVAVRNGEAVETHTVFSQQPEFNLVAGRGTKGLVDAIELAANGVGKQRRIRILGAPDGRHFVQLLAPAERGAAWPLAIGRPVVLGDLGLDVLLEEALPHAVASAWPRAASPVGSGSAFVRVAASGANPAKTGEWLRLGTDATMQVDGKPVALRFCARRAQLPFSVRVQSAEVERRPGTTAPARYTSELLLRSGDEPVQRVPLGNHEPAASSGYRLVQRGYAPGQGDVPATVVLAVGHEPGRHLVHAGLCLLLVGAFGLSLRRTAAPQRAAACLLLVSLACTAPLTAQSESGMPLATTRDWPIQADGRLVPFESWARAQLVAIAGRSASESVDPLEFAWDLQFAPAALRQRRLVRVPGAELRRMLNLTEEQPALSYDELLAHETFRALVEAGQTELPEGAERLPAGQQALAVYDRLLAMAAIMDGTALRFLPTGRTDGAWASLADLRNDGSTKARKLLEELQAMAACTRDRDAAGFRTHAESFRRQVDESHGGAVPGAAERRLELLHGDLDASSRAALVCVLATVLLAVSTRRRWARHLGTALAGCGLLLLLADTALLLAATGRFPVESPASGLRFTATATLAIAFGLWWRTRSRAPLVLAAPVATIALWIAAALPPVDAFAPLSPGLADPFWLSLHGATTAAAFGALALAAALAHAVAARPQADGGLLHALVRARELGTLLLAAGIASGVLWAEGGWGRQFGFEPRETWATATALLYVAVAMLHANGRLSPFAQSVATLFAFAAAVGTWFVVDSLYGPSLHSHAATDSAGLVGLWLLLEVGFLAAAALRLRVVRAAG